MRGGESSNERFVLGTCECVRLSKPKRQIWRCLKSQETLMSFSPSLSVSLVHSVNVWGINLELFHSHRCRHISGPRGKLVLLNIVLPRCVSLRKLSVWETNKSNHVYLLWKGLLWSYFTVWNMSYVNFRLGWCIGPQKNSITAISEWRLSVPWWGKLFSEAFLHPDTFWH